MNIITEVNAEELRQMFLDYNRDDYSRETYEGIVNFYEDVYGDEPTEFDVIGWCTELREYRCILDTQEYPEVERIIKEFGEFSGDAPKELFEKIMEYLYNNFTVICSNQSDGGSVTFLE